jgi:uncharacterized protein (TIGR03905 family)
VKIEFTPKGVCSQHFTAQISDDGTIESLEIAGGCPGNAAGLCQLVKGRKATEIASLLSGIRCGRKPTSCPDQLARMLSHRE